MITPHGRIHLIQRAFAALALASLTAGCADPAAPASPGRSATPGAVHGDVTVAAAAGQELARAVALAMGDAAVRVQLRNAWRRSPYAEHKLVLQDYASTAEGGRLVEAAARAAGVAPATVRGWMAGLPPLDFYVPVREHRRAWRGGDHVVVGLNLDPDDPTLTAYTAGGAALHLDRRDGVPAATVVILHPAEPKTLLARAAGPGETIEDPGEPGGTQAVCPQPLSAPRAPLGGATTQSTDGPTCTITGGSYTTPPRLYSFRAYVDDGWGAAEVSFRHYSTDLNGNQNYVWRWEHGSTDPFVLYTPQETTVIAQTVEVYELDAFLTGGDDYWGDAAIGPSGQVTDVMGPCGPVFRDGDWAAHCGGSDAFYWNREINTVDVVYYY